MASSPAVEQAPRDSILQTIVSTVAEYTDSDPLDLEPLQYTIDTETLPSRSEADRSEELSNGVAFTYCGCEVEVSTDGVVHVSDAK